MSRLKFRVWDNDFEQYINHGENRMELHPDGSLIVEYWEDYSATQYIDITKEPERYVIEQCTGLKDRSGRLIYEGDIVQSERQCWQNGKLVKEIYKFVVAYYGAGFRLIPREDGYGGGGAIVWCSTSYEIIGNIHEVK